MITGTILFLNNSEYFRMQEIAQVFSFPDTFADKGRTDLDKGSLYDSDMRRQTGCILQGITLARIDQNVVAADDFFGRPPAVESLPVVGTDNQVKLPVRITLGQFIKGMDRV